MLGVNKTLGCEIGTQWNHLCCWDQKTRRNKNVAVVVLQTIIVLSVLGFDPQMRTPRITARGVSHISGWV